MMLMLSWFVLSFIIRWDLDQTAPGQTGSLEQSDGCQVELWWGSGWRRSSNDCFQDGEACQQSLETLSAFPTLLQGW